MASDNPWFNIPREVIDVLQLVVVTLARPTIALMATGDAKGLSLCISVTPTFATWRLLSLQTPKTHEENDFLRFDDVLCQRRDPCQTRRILFL